MLIVVQKVLDEVSKSFPSASDHTYLGEEAESMRWFLLPSEAQRALLEQATPTATPPFHPRCYPKTHGSTSPRDITSSSIIEATSIHQAKLVGNENVDMSSDVTERSELNREQNLSEEPQQGDLKKPGEVVKFHCPPKIIYKPTTEVQAYACLCVCLH